MQNTFKIGVLFIGLLLILSQCTDDPTKNTGIETPTIQEQFSKQAFSNVIPFEFEVEWNNGFNGYSKERESAYHEFPVTKTNTFGHGRVNDREVSFIKYKVLAIPKQNAYEFFVLKYISNQQYSSLSQSKLGKFTGNIYMMTSQGQKLSARHYENGKFMGDLIPEQESLESPDSMYRMFVECYTETTYHWTDWYLHGEFIGSTLDHVTEEEYCYNTGGVSGGPSGGGGGGSTTYDEYTEDELNIDEQLDSIVEQDPFSLLEIPCEEIPKWQALAQQTAPQSVINKLEQEYYGDINILSLEDAAGTVVNMDYFSVDVNNLPSGMSAEELLNEIRMSNINDFIDTKYASFSPYDYPGYSFDEASVWHSSNPLGAVLSIDILLPADDGSVVVSKFNSTGWTFSTLSDPWNFDHPVSGNRSFGFTQNNDGSYTFYTRGVDRITQGFDNFIAQNFLDDPFEDPDALWSSFQQKLSNYVNQNGGSATANEPKTYRPDWDQVFNVLTGKADPQILGCN